MVGSISPRRRASVDRVLFHIDLNDQALAAMTRLPVRRANLKSASSS
jgi:hypothetical protein